MQRTARGRASVRGYQSPSAPRCTIHLSWRSGYSRATADKPCELHLRPSRRRYTARNANTGRRGAAA